MKVQLFSTLLLVCLFFSCGKDNPCEDVVCLNGGECLEGVCQCPTGFTGANCETPPDPCAGINCFNGGICLNGLCSCPDGFTGPACESEVMPTKVILSSISVTRFPATDNGVNWDLSTGPDMQIVIVDPDGNEILGPVVMDYANSSGFTFIWTVELTNKLDENYTITLVDNDTGLAAPSDFMGGYNFTPYVSGFPPNFIFDNSQSLVGMEGVISYEW